MALLAPACGLASRPPLSAAHARDVAPLAALAALAALTALAATDGLSVPMFITLRRFTAAAAMAAERVTLGRAPDRASVAAVAAMAAGAALAVATEGHATVAGYAAVAANCGVTAWHLLALRTRAPPPGLSAAGLLAYTAALAAPPLLAASVLTGELWRAGHAGAAPGGRAGAAFALAVSALAGGAVHHATYLCSRGPHAAATAAVGAAKNVATAVAGGAAFDYLFSPANAAGHALSTVGAAAYGAAAAARAARKVGAQATPLVRRDPGGAPLIGRDRLERLNRAAAAAAVAAAAATGGAGGGSPPRAAPAARGDDVV